MFTVYFTPISILFPQCGQVKLAVSLFTSTSLGDTNNCQNGTPKLPAIAFKVFADASCFPLIIFERLTRDIPTLFDNSIAVNPFSAKISLIRFSIMQNFTCYCNKVKQYFANNCEIKELHYKIQLDVL